jgi:hypothetical protein
MTAEVLTGGCQCGAVRFRFEGEIRRASVCHCRMCQKAFGAPFGAFASVQTADVAWTRGRRKMFQSSNAIVRGFCGDCGTPLTFEAASGGASLGLAIGAFDNPSAIRPERQLGLESRVAWLDDLNDLRLRTPEEEAEQEARYGPRTSYQHPDHDTEAWPLPDGGPAV